MSQPLYNVEDLAKLLTISRSGVRQMIATGQFPVAAFKIGRRWYVRRAEFDLFLRGA
jgi:excisionase family DNA binding protein